MTDSPSLPDLTPTRSAPTKRFAAMAVALVSVIALAASAGSNEATKVGEDASGASESGASAPDGGGKFAVGDTVALGDWTVTVNGVTDPFTSSNQFDTPQDRYVAVDTTVANNSDAPATVSSLLCFELRDSTGRTYNQALVVGGGATPDGEVDPGGILRGDLYYDVPAGVTGLQLRFKCDLFSSGSAVINL